MDSSTASLLRMVNRHTFLQRSSAVTDCIFRTTVYLRSFCAVWLRMDVEKFGDKTSAAWGVNMVSRCSGASMQGLKSRNDKGWSDKNGILDRAFAEGRVMFSGVL
jgi:hypothetical protein